MELRNLDGDILATGSTVKSILEAETCSRVSTAQRKSFKRADLRNMNLTDVVMCASTDAKSGRRSDFMGADFSGSNLMGAKLAGLDLRGCDFTDCDFRKASITMCDMTSARLDGVDMGAYTENRTGYSTWITRTIFDDVHAEEGDFGSAMLSAVSAVGALFKNCNFEYANFNGNWDGATFHKCNLEDSNPGTPVAGTEGAKFGVSICECNTKDMLLDGCPCVPTEITECDLPVKTWVSTWTLEDDHWDVTRKKTRDIERGKLMIFYERIAAEYQAKADAKVAKRKAETDALIAKAQQYERDYQARQAEAERARMVSDRARQEVSTASKVATLPQLTGAFEPKPVSFINGVHRIRIEFNRALRVGWRTVLNQGFVVTGGKITRVQRVNGRSDYWELTVKPAGAGSIVITSTESLVGSGGQQLKVAATVTI